MEIRINRANNGWIVTAGCQTLVFKSEELAVELVRFINDPDKVWGEYQARGEAAPTRSRLEATEYSGRRILYKAPGSDFHVRGT